MECALDGEKAMCIWRNRVVGGGKLLTLSESGYPYENI